VSVRTLRSEPVNQTVGALNADSFKTANATYGFQIWHACFQLHSVRYHLIFFRTSGCGQGHVTYDGDMDGLSRSLSTFKFHTAPNCRRRVFGPDLYKLDLICKIM